MKLSKAQKEKPDDATGKICDIGDLTGTNYDMSPIFHKGFTVGKGSVMYWYMIWHKSGTVTVYSSDLKHRRFLMPDAQITVHFK